jgi:hypothetical protein
VLKIDLLDTCLFIPAYKAGLSRQDSGNLALCSKRRKVKTHENHAAG